MLLGKTSATHDVMPVRSHGLQHRDHHDGDGDHDHDKNGNGDHDHDGDGGVAMPPFIQYLIHNYQY